MKATIVKKIYSLFVLFLWIIFVYIITSFIYGIKVSDMAFQNYILSLNQKTIGELKSNFLHLYNFFDLRQKKNVKKTIQKTENENSDITTKYTGDDEEFFSGEKEKLNSGDDISKQVENLDKEIENMFSD